MKKGKEERLGHLLPSGNEKEEHKKETDAWPESVPDSGHENSMLSDREPEVIWATDNEGNTTYVSPNILDIFGHDSGKVYDDGGRVRIGRINRDNIENVKQAFEELFEKVTNFDFDFQVKKREGKWIWLDDSEIKHPMINGKDPMKGAYLGRPESGRTESTGEQGGRKTTQEDDNSVKRKRRDPRRRKPE